MGPTVSAATLHGFINPVDLTPAFVLPVFLGEGGGNHLLVQIVDQDGCVQGFTPVDTGVYVLNRAVDAVRVEVGHPALWGFQWDDAHWLIADGNRLRKELADQPASPDIPPLLQLGIARFLCRDTDVADLSRKAFEHLAIHSPHSAALWRDLVVLLPAARQALKTALPPTATVCRALDDVLLSCDDALLRVEVPEAILAAFTQDKDRLIAALEPARRLATAFDVARIEILERSDVRATRSKPEMDAHLRPLVTLVPLSQIGFSLALAAGKHRRLRILEPAKLMTKDGSRLSPSADARAGDIFILLLADRADELEDAEHIARSLVGRGCFAVAILARSYDSTAPSSPPINQITPERRFNALARATRWLMIVGGPQTSGPSLLPLVTGAEPSRNSPTLIGKWVIRAILAAAQDPTAGYQVLHLLHRRSRGPKFAIAGVGSAAGPTATPTAVEAAYASASASLLDPAKARYVAVVLLRGPRAEADAKQHCLNEVRRRVSSNTEVNIHEVVLPTYKNRVRVVLLARGFPGASISWTPPAYLGQFRDYGWSYQELETEIWGLDLVIWQGTAEFGVRVELDRGPITDKDVGEIATETPMYRGPVVLLLEHLPEAKVRNRLLTHGIICASVGRIDLLGRLATQPYRTILSRLLRARPSDILQGAASLIRDFLMSLLWQEEPGATVWDRPGPEGDDSYEVPQWLTETELQDGRLSQFQIDQRGPGRVIYFSGVLHLRPREAVRVAPVNFGFKLALDDQGLRLREPMRANPIDNRGDDADQLNLDL